MESGSQSASARAIDRESERASGRARQTTRKRHASLNEIEHKPIDRPATTACIYTCAAAPVLAPEGAAPNPKRSDAWPPPPPPIPIPPPRAAAPDEGGPKGSSPKAPSRSPDPDPCLPALVCAAEKSPNKSPPPPTPPPAPSPPAKPKGSLLPEVLKGSVLPKSPKPADPKGSALAALAAGAAAGARREQGVSKIKG